MPFVAYKTLTKLKPKDTGQEGELDKEYGFSETAKVFFGGEDEILDSGRRTGKRVKVIEEAHLENRETLEADEKLEKEEGSGKLPGMQKM
jgi:hypothetical protein